MIVMSRFLLFFSPFFCIMQIFITNKLFFAWYFLFFLLIYANFFSRLEKGALSVILKKLGAVGTVTFTKNTVCHIVFVCGCVWVFTLWKELLTVASASLILSPADVPSSLSNHLGLPSGTLQSPLHIRCTHVPWKRTQVFSLSIGTSWGGERLWGPSEG